MNECRQTDVQCLVHSCADRCVWCTNKKCRKRWFLTYYCRNVSVGRVIGIHIGRVMGRRKHSVVVDSESWMKKQTNKQTNSNRHSTGDRGEQWEGRAAQVWDRVMVSGVLSGKRKQDDTHHARVYTRSLYNISPRMDGQHCWENKITVFMSNINKNKMKNIVSVHKRSRSRPKRCTLISC